jgi:hypothetical protein
MGAEGLRARKSLRLDPIAGLRVDADHAVFLAVGDETVMY